MTDYDRAPNDRRPTPAGGRPAPSRRGRGTRRRSDAFVLFAASLVATAVAAGLYFQAGLGPLPSAIGGAALFILSALVNLILRRIQAISQLRRDVSRIDHELDSYRNPDLDPAELDPALAASGWEVPDFETGESEEPSAPARARSSARGTYDEMRYEGATADDRVVNDLVRHLAHELDRGSRSGLVGPGMTDVDDDAPVGEETGTAELDRPALPSLAGDDIDGQQDADDPVESLVRAAIADRAIDIYLQPIISLADRKARFYEIFPHVLNGAQAPIATQEAVAAASRIGLRVEFDGVMLSRVAEILNRLIERGKARPFFVRLSRGSLGDPAILKLFVEMMRTSRPLTDFLVFELSLADHGSLSPIEIESLDSLGQLGFRFALAEIDTLELTGAALHASHVAFLKVRTAVIEDTIAQVGDGFAAVLADQRKAGVEIVLEGIEGDDSLLLARRWQIALGQGDLFSEPRPLRTDMLRGSASSAA